MICVVESMTIIFLPTQTNMRLKSSMDVGSGTTEAAIVAVISSLRVDLLTGIAGMSCCYLPGSVTDLIIYNIRNYWHIGYW